MSEENKNRRIIPSEPVDLSEIPIPQRRRKGVRISDEDRPRIQEEFLKAFANCANVRAACQITGLHHGTIAWWRTHDPEFEEKYLEAEDEANWLLFGEAWRRAMQGEEEYVVSVGKLIYGPDGKPLTIRRRSDKLLELLLKARIPAFKTQGPTVVNILPKEYLSLPEDGTEK